MATPLSIVKERFESKDKLVEAVQELMTEELWLPRTSEDRNGKKDISSVSNAKLIRLHTVLSEVKKEFGSRAKLIAAILEVENRSKDGDYQKRLERYAAPRLLDQYKSSKRRGGYKGKPVSKTQDAAAPRPKPKPRPKAKAKAKAKTKAPAKTAKRAKKKTTKR